MSDINEIFDLYIKNGDNDYIGENVSQIEHALQAALLAENQSYPDHVILASFLHDIGHLLEDHQSPLMIYNSINYGPQNHEKLGADFLRKLKIPESICYLVENHVTAKRYLVFKNPSYYEKLSDASKQTLVFQGGKMNELEALNFEQNESFDVILKMRDWDDLAKDKSLNLALKSNDLLNKYKIMLNKLIELK